MYPLHVVLKAANRLEVVVANWTLELELRLEARGVGAGCETSDGQATVNFCLTQLVVLAFVEQV